MATNCRKNDENNNELLLTNVTGYRVGNCIRVVSRASTYHGGQEGAVWRFCQNRLTKNLYVMLDGDDEMRRTQRCMFMKSLVNII
jgi:hypothetical protein